AFDDAGANRDRAARPWRRQLNETDLVTDLVVVIGVEPDLFGIEGLGAIHVGYGNPYEFKLPVHPGRPFLLRRSRTRATRSHKARWGSFVTATPRGARCATAKPCDSHPRLVCL